ncbi:MAG: hypothetical protein QOF91_376 [Alphaproteobacteria bacterium]|jgi:hypothetical protein|nr:hypothetical protein [Alphaproteobacteria bacterium]
MTTDPYPDVSVDESGIVPPQGTRPSEWPKKLRTLTAAELDRLTIDNNGRFYWDGKLVNYDTQPKQLTDKSSDSLDRSMDILDRASYELGNRKPPATIEGQLAPETPARSSEPGHGSLDAVRVHDVRPPPDAATETHAAAAQAIHPAGPTRVTLTHWQTLGAVIVVVAIAVGAFGMATYGYVAARDWGCKTGTFHDGCPANVRPARSDIPA